MKDLGGGVRRHEFLGTLYASIYQGETQAGEAEREIAGRQTCRIRLADLYKGQLRNQCILFGKLVQEKPHVKHLSLHERIVSEYVLTGLIWVRIGSKWRTTVSKLISSQIP
jgi:hypothetical protein